MSIARTDNAYKSMIQAPTTHYSSSVIMYSSCLETSNIEYLLCKLLYPSNICVMCHSFNY